MTWLAKVGAAVMLFFGSLFGGTSAQPSATVSTTTAPTQHSTPTPTGNVAATPRVTVLKNGFSRDATHVYYLPEHSAPSDTPFLIEDADPSTFTIISDNYAEDARSVWF